MKGRASRPFTPSLLDPLSGAHDDGVEHQPPAEQDPGHDEKRRPEKPDAEMKRWYKLRTQTAESKGDTCEVCAYEMEEA